MATRQEKIRGNLLEKRRQKQEYKTNKEKTSFLPKLVAGALVGLEAGWAYLASKVDGYLIRDENGYFVDPSVTVNFFPIPDSTPVRGMTLNEYMERLKFPEYFTGLDEVAAAAIMNPWASIPIVAAFDYLVFRGTKYLQKALGKYLLNKEELASQEMIKKKVADDYRFEQIATPQEEISRSLDELVDERN